MMKSYLVSVLTVGLVANAWATLFVGNPSAGNGYDTTSAVSIIGHSGERDSGVDPASARVVLNTINGFGMASATLHNDGAPHGQMAMFANPPAGGGASAPNPGTLQSTGSHWVTYGLDQPYELSNMWIWNHNETTWYVQGWSNIVVQTSLNNGPNPSDWTTVFTGDLPLAPGAGAAPSVESLKVPLGGASIQYVTLINAGIGDGATWLPGDDGSHAGLSEVRFEIIPEPATLVLLGVGMLAMSLRRRSRRL